MLKLVKKPMAQTAERLSSPEIVLLSTPAALAGLEIHSTLGAFSAYGPRRSAIVRESLDMVLRTPGSEVFAAVADHTIVGYLLAAPVGSDQPWGRLRDPRVLDIAIEVARDYRGQGVAQALFRRAFLRPEVESRIYVATGYAWCWDVEGTGLDAPSYANRLLKLFERFGFRRDWTNERTIALMPSNFLAVRIGCLVPADLIRRFRRAARGDLAT